MAAITCGFGQKGTHPFFAARAERRGPFLCAKARAYDPGVDTDLDALSREQLVAEVKRLRKGIRAHRDSTGHDLCWHHPDLWGLLPEKSDPLPRVPEWPQFMEGCVRYRLSLDRQLPGAPRTKKPAR